MATAFLGGSVSVNDVATVVLETVFVDILGARFAILPGNTRDLHYRHRRTVGEDDSHLQKGADVGGDVRLGICFEGFRTVAALHDKGFSECYLSKSVLKFVDFSGHNDGRH